MRFERPINAGGGGGGGGAGTREVGGGGQNGRRVDLQSEDVADF